MEEVTEIDNTEDAGIHWECEYDYYIICAYNALAAIEMYSPADVVNTKQEDNRIRNVKKKALYLISGCMDRLVKCFDECSQEPPQSGT